MLSNYPNWLVITNLVIYVVIVILLVVSIGLVFKKFYYKSMVEKMKNKKAIRKSNRINRKKEKFSMSSYADEIRLVAFFSGRRHGYDVGYLDGKEIGYTNGFNEGFNEGKEIGISEGFDAAVDEGFTAGTKVDRIEDEKSLDLSKLSDEELITSYFSILHQLLTDLGVLD